MNRILILGGGASGIAAAIAAAEHASPDTEILLLEQNKTFGKKLLATGNGRCNLDNTHCSVEHYFTSNQALAGKLLEEIDRIQLPQWFADHGLLCRETENGRLYPYSNQASDVVALLTYWLEQHKVQLHTDCRVTQVQQTDTGYTVATESGDIFDGNAVICAMGGNAGPQFGSDGFGIRTAFRVGCRMEPLYPALVPLKCNSAEIQGLAGIRVKAEATLYDGTVPLHTEIGEIQFTDYGISGIAIMQLSGWLGAQHGIHGPNIQLNLFPQYTESELARMLTDRAAHLPDATIAAYMIGLIHPQVGLAVWTAQKLGDSSRHTDTLTAEEWHHFANGLQHWQFTDLADIGWKQAQTTGGGIALDQLELHSCQLKHMPGLYFTGETIDCAGACGGYNLHLAFGSGILAGRHAAESLKLVL